MPHIATGPAPTRSVRLLGGPCAGKIVKLLEGTSTYVSQGAVYRYAGTRHAVGQPPALDSFHFVGSGLDR